MSDALDGFFSAWSDPNPTTRRETIGAAMAPDFIYLDPRSDGRIRALDDLSDYVGEFSANAPGWTAHVARSDSVGSYRRSVVGFGEGDNIQQHGTYFSEHAEDGKIVQLIGFVGTGAPE